MATGEVAEVARAHGRPGTGQRAPSSGLTGACIYLTPSPVGPAASPDVDFIAFALPSPSPLRRGGERLGGCLAAGGACSPPSLWHPAWAFRQ